MKNIKIYEILTSLLIITVSVMIVFGYALASTGSGTSINYTPEYPTQSEPFFIKPGTSMTTVNGELLEMEVYAPNALVGSGFSQFLAIYPVSGTVATFSENYQLARSDGGTLIFPPVNVSAYPAGTYRLMAKLTYQDPVNPALPLYKPAYTYFSIQNSSVTSSTTTTTVNQATNTTPTTLKTVNIATPTTSTSTSTTIPVSTIDEQIKIVESNNFQNIGIGIKEVQEILIKKEEEKQLPEELKTAPEVTVLKTVDVEVSMVDSTKGTVKLTGKAEPNQLVYLYIFSDPIVVSVKADNNGDWEYNLDKELATGEHKVYVAVKNDDNTVKAKSSAFSFLIGEAIAASPTQNQTANKVNSAGYLFYYIMFAVSLITLIISVIFFVLTKKKIKQHGLQLQS